MTIYWTSEDCHGQAILTLHLSVGQVIIIISLFRSLGHVRRMDDGRIPKCILYGELAFGRRTTGHPHLRYKRVCVRDMKAVDIDTMS